MSDLSGLPSIPVPRELTRPRGCDCGGSLDVHQTTCAILSLPHEEALAAVEEVRGRLREHTAQLNRELRASLKKLEIGE